MNQITVAHILNRWPDRRSVLEDAREADKDLALVAVHRWISRSSIPGKYWSALVRGAERRSIALSAEELMLAHEPQDEARGAA